MSSNTNNVELASKLTRLQNSYRQRIARELSEIATLMDALHSAVDIEQTLTTLYMRLHQLAGSAGTFGFHQLGHKCRVLEHQVQEQLRQTHALMPDSQEIGQLKTQISLLNEDLKSDESVPNNPAIAHERLKKEDPERYVIVLVERDPILGAYIAYQLRSFGYIVHCFTDPEALETIPDPPPDLLLIDHRAIDSPQGYSVAEYWREKLTRMPSCPIIFMGGQEDFHSRLGAVQAGAEGYFVKPLDLPFLATRIGRLTRERRQPAGKVLIIADKPSPLRDAAAALEDAGMTVSTLGTPEQMLEHAAGFQPELVILDETTGAYSGNELAAILRQFEKWSNLPILFATSEQPMGAVSEHWLETGDDFINLPVSNQYLVSTARNRIRRLREIEENIAHDGLTGLLKHVNIKNALSQELSASRRTGNPMSIVMLDIDHFKSVNDTYGHALGDMVISTVGTLLRQHFRSSDQLGRYGGEEFLLVLPNCNSAAAKSLISELRQAFSEISFVSSGERFNCTLSAGIADTENQPELTAEQFLEKADATLYRAKAAGRNTVCEATGPFDV